jgi:hypothetical protein
VTFCFTLFCCLVACLLWVRKRSVSVCIVSLSLHLLLHSPSFLLWGSP